MQKKKVVRYRCTKCGRENSGVVQKSLALAAEV